MLKMAWNILFKLGIYDFAALKCLGVRVSLQIYHLKYLVYVQYKGYEYCKCLTFWVTNLKRDMNSETFECHNVRNSWILQYIPGPPSMNIFTRIVLISSGIPMMAWNIFFKTRNLWLCRIELSRNSCLFLILPLEIFLHTV